MSKYSYPDDIEEELSRLQQRDRRYTIVLIFLLLFIALISVRLYYKTQETENNTINAIQNATQLSDSSVPQASAGGCGGGGSSSGGCGSSSGGGGCGSSEGGSQVSSPELEKKVLEMYKSQFGNVESISAKVIDLGCHQEIDVVDKGSNLLKKYQLRGGQITLLPQ